MISKALLLIKLALLTVDLLTTVRFITKDDRDKPLNAPVRLPFASIALTDCNYTPRSNNNIHTVKRNYMCIIYYATHRLSFLNTIANAEILEKVEKALVETRIIQLESSTIIFMNNNVAGYILRFSLLFGSQDDIIQI